MDAGGTNGSSTMSRAEKFEDEKRRIIDSCFAKKDEDGSCKMAFADQRGVGGLGS